MDGYYSNYDLYKVKYYDASIQKVNHFLVVAENFDKAVELAKELMGDNTYIETVKFIETTIIVQREAQND